MKQWIIDRYNKGQDKYWYPHKENAKNWYSNLLKKTIPSDTNLYDFLFNPKWGFAKAFWGENSTQNMLCKECYAPTKWINKYQYHLQQMAISKDPLEYLEQFKEVDFGEAVAKGFSGIRDAEAKWEVK